MGGGRSRKGGGGRRGGGGAAGERGRVSGKMGPQGDGRPEGDQGARRGPVEEWGLGAAGVARSLSGWGRRGSGGAAGEEGTQGKRGRRGAREGLRGTGSLGGLGPGGGPVEELGWGATVRGVGPQGSGPVMRCASSASGSEPAAHRRGDAAASSPTLRGRADTRAWPLWCERSRDLTTTLSPFSRRKEESEGRDLGMTSLLQKSLRLSGETTLEHRVTIAQTEV